MRFNPIERLQHTQWEIYQATALKIQVASCLLCLVSAVALTVIFAMSPSAAFISANAPAFIALGTMGGVSFVLFAVFSCAQYMALRKIKRDTENTKTLETLKDSPVDTHIEVTTTLEENPIEYMKQVIIQPLLRAFKGALRSMVVADCIITSSAVEKKLEEVECAFEEGEQLISEFLDSPQIYVLELLRCFGPGKKPMSVALRRMIAAYNAGAPERKQEVIDEFKAIASGHNLKEVIIALKEQESQALMRTLPDLLENHFSLANQPLKELGNIILKHIFEKTRDNSNVLNALKQLKKCKAEKFPKELENFIKLVLEEAKITNEQYRSWNKELTTRMLQTSFKRTVCNVLSMIARNVRILKLMFDENKEKKEIFITLDETFLLSESNDCIASEKKSFQKELYHVQSDLNFLRREDDRYALVALKAGDMRPYGQLIREEEIIRFCFGARKSEMDKEELEALEKINQSKIIQALNKMHHVRLVTVPISITNHPFKDFKEHEELIQVGAWLLKPFLPRLVKPKLMQILPKMEGDRLARFEKLFGTIINLMIDPVYDGAIGDTDFRPVFENVFTTKGEELAEAIEGLLREPDLNFERIRDVWAAAVSGVAEEFIRQVNNNIIH
jgi:membrane protein implicated in regulation of membrane protease activity/uncharacterized protein YifE (UPF0438 family)